MITPDQQATLDRVSQAAVGLMKAAREAETRGLPILAQWLKDASVGCQVGVDFQKRALGDNLSTQTERKVIDHKPNPHNDATRSPMLEGGEKQADVIADAMKRRGMLP